jgi:hypothetical protein
MKKSGSAAPQGVAICALRHPSLLDQLFRDYRDCAALKPGMARQIGSRDRLMTSNQVQHDAPINVACGFAPCNLEVVEIYLSHLGKPRSSGEPFVEGQFGEHDGKQLICSRRELIAESLFRVNSFQ